MIITSTLGRVVFLGRNPIIWCSKKQKSIVKYSTEVEYRFVSSTIAELIWLQILLIKMGICSTHTTVVYCDILGTYLSANPVFYLHFVSFMSKFKKTDFTFKTKAGRFTSQERTIGTTVRLEGNMEDNIKVNT